LFLSTDCFISAYSLISFTSPDLFHCDPVEVIEKVGKHGKMRMNPLWTRKNVEGLRSFTLTIERHCRTVCARTRNKNYDSAVSTKSTGYFKRIAHLPCSKELDIQLESEDHRGYESKRVEMLSLAIQNQVANLYKHSSYDTSVHSLVAYFRPKTLLYWPPCDPLMET
jgi:hypothetical protein